MLAGVRYTHAKNVTKATCQIKSKQNKIAIHAKNDAKGNHSGRQNRRKICVSWTQLGNWGKIQIHPIDGCLPLLTAAFSGNQDKNFGLDLAFLQIYCTLRFSGHSEWGPWHYTSYQRTSTCTCRNRRPVCAANSAIPVDPAVTQLTNGNCARLVLS